MNWFWWRRVGGHKFSCMRPQAKMTTNWCTLQEDQIFIKGNKKKNKQAGSNDFLELGLRFSLPHQDYFNKVPHLKAQRPERRVLSQFFPWESWTKVGLDLFRSTERKPLPHCSPGFQWFLAIPGILVKASLQALFWFYIAYFSIHLWVTKIHLLTRDN